MVIQANATATAVTAAADATLSTDSDYKKITAGWATGHVVGISFSTDKLVVPVAGDYYISFWATVKVPTLNNFIGIKYAINDVAPYSTRKIVEQAATANDYKNMSASGIIASLAANDTISVYIAGTKADNLEVQEAGLTVMLIHPD